MGEEGPVYKVEDGLVYYNGLLLASAASIVGDPGQDLAKKGLILSHRLPTGERSFTDYLMVSERAHGVILVEEKRMADLANSFKSRRLQRQLRRMLLVNPGGVNVLAFRGGLTQDLWTNFYAGELRMAGVPIELLKWQLLGGYLGFLPTQPQDAVAALKTWRAVVEPGRHLLSILAGDDRKPEDSGLTPVAAALMRMVPGVGRKTATSWADYAGGELIKALQLTPAKLKAAGVHQGIQKRLRGILGY